MQAEELGQGLWPRDSVPTQSHVGASLADGIDNANRNAQQELGKTKG